MLYNQTRNGRNMGRAGFPGNKKIQAFTLAEVLITLGIIGVIAALTIPTLIQNQQDRQFIVGWKKVYSLLSQATLSYKNDNGGLVTGFTSNAQMRDSIKPYFSGATDCSPTVGVCWPTNPKQPDGTSFSNWSDVPGLILKDGAVVRFFTWPALPCSESDYYTTGECGFYQVDLNGTKGPNIAGRDMFVIHVLPDRIVPSGALNSRWSESSCATSGFGCAAKMLSY